MRPSGPPGCPLPQKAGRLASSQTRLSTTTPIFPGLAHSGLSCRWGRLFPLQVQAERGPPVVTLFFSDGSAVGGGEAEQDPMSFGAPRVDTSFSKS